MKYLNLIKYHDLDTSEKKELRILKDLAADWENIGETLGLGPSEIATIRNAGAGTTPEQGLRGVITVWMQNADNMPCSKLYPCTWTGLYKVLMDSEHGTTANNLKAAISATRSDLHQNYDDGEIYTEDHALSCFYKSLNCFD